VRRHGADDYGDNEEAQHRCPRFKVIQCPCSVQAQVYQGPYIKKGYGEALNGASEVTGCCEDSDGFFGYEEGDTSQGGAYL